VLYSTARRIAGAGADAGGLERGRVSPDRVPVRALEEHRAIGQHRVEVVKRERYSDGLTCTTSNQSVPCAGCRKHAATLALIPAVANILSSRLHLP